MEGESDGEEEEEQPVAVNNQNLQTPLSKKEKAKQER